MSTQRIVYLDLWSGISGDMFLASLLDTDRTEGRLERVLRETVASFGLDGVDLEIERDVEWGIACTRLRVVEGTAPELRHLADMESIIARSALPAEVASKATEAVRRLAEVEVGIHGCSVDDIHFHEVGAVDTLVDVVGAFALVHALGSPRIVVGTVPVGGGTVEIAHGRMGVPAPATARLLEGFEIVGGPEMRELTTPTGALLLAQLGAEQGGLPAMVVERIGHGAGTMKLEHGPNVLRTMIGTAATQPTGQKGDQVVELQTNLDDVSAEVVAYACRKLREAGALDVWTEAVHMKKDRPGFVLHVLAARDGEQAVLPVVFSETGTLGVRRQCLSRYLAERGSLSVDVFGHPIRVKWGAWGGRVTTLAAEYDDASAVASGLDMALKDVMEAAVLQARAALAEGRLAQ